MMAKSPAKDDAAKKRGIAKSKSSNAPASKADSKQGNTRKADAQRSGSQKSLKVKGQGQANQKSRTGKKNASETAHQSRKNSDAKKQERSTGTRSKVPSRGQSHSKVVSSKRKPKSAAASGMWTLHLISDFTGNLANHLVSSVMSQFPVDTAQRIIHRFCDSSEKLAQTLAAIKDPKQVLLHAVIDPLAKQQIQKHADQRQLPCHDLTGPLTGFLSQTLQQAPLNAPDRLHATDEQYFERIDAMEFTLQHDDSRRLETIHQADIVLVGLSRVSKSPTSTYLGSLGYKAANVSFAPELGLPKELSACRGKIVGLTMQPKRLFEIRQRRFRLNRFADAFAERKESISYLDVREVMREVMAAEAMYREAGIPTVDVTHMTIEEAASHVLDTLGLLRV